MRRAARTDANHGEIRDALRRAGCLVVDTSGVGGGFPDLVAVRHGRVRFVEVKDGAKSASRRKLTPAEAEFIADCAYHGVTVHVVTSVAEAFEAMGVRTG
jgi:Holliday junction resolvase